MKKLLIILLFLACVIPCFGAFTQSITTRKTYKNSYRWTGRARDLMLDWAEEVEGRLLGTTAVEFTFFDPTDTEPGTSKGMMYMDESESKLRYYNGGSWVTIESGSACNSLDGAYDIGRTISVDAGSVILTATNAADNVVLALIQSDAGTTKGFTITNAGTGNTIDIQGQSSSNDIEGTDDSWAISSAGAFTGVVGTWTGDQTWTGSAANVIFDATDDELLIEDDAVLSFGDVADVTITWNQTNLLIEAATDNTGQIQLGATNAMDLKIVGSTNTDIALFDANPGILLLDSYPLALGDGDSILFGDTLGTGDFSITDTSDVLVITNVVDGTGTVGFGTAGAGIDVAFHGDAGSATATWDENQNTNGALVFNNADIELGDADLINFGDSDDFSMTATNQAFTFGSLTSDESSTYSFGADTDGDDVKMFGATTGEYWLWDAGADSILPVCGNALYTLTDAEADQFKVNATGATSDAVAINFETTDGKILLNADGGTGGDIELNSADDIILTTAGKLTITNGSEAMTVSGALTVAGTATFNGTIVGDGATTVVGTKAVETTDIDNEIVTIAQSGTVFNNSGDADGTTFTLPEASTALGCWYTFVVTETGQQIAIDLDGSDVFLHLSLGAGDKMTSSTLGDTITVSAVSATQWGIISVYPTAADWADGGA
ncbi:hypothetical protein LCGC14_1151020 [marine sediment metagenome]|uniref:Uncharacterized protein n=1 Tax=marine sediment metagenome TaxID=412755 RepID=A0A0F9PDM2_9ZZZZ